VFVVDGVVVVVVEWSTHLGGVARRECVQARDAF
jgi:hypothetical protein